MNSAEIIRYLEKVDLKSICSELSDFQIYGILLPEGLIKTMMRSFNLTVLEAEYKIVNYVISAVSCGLLRDIRTDIN
ncbi:MAG: hypothetical protein M0R48_08720 [Candidatus Omnitrophica bacterium]|jgi:hypothetical protein|nr:hypothetical protein [Candidatus Omnitrophota bacterium]